jgi:hypothetical protein
MRCPVPPRSQYVPQRLMCAPITQPVGIVRNDSSDLVLDIWCPAGMAALDHVAGILDHYQQHREDVLPPRRSLQRIDTAVAEQFQ